MSRENTLAQDPASLVSMSNLNDFLTAYFPTRDSMIKGLKYLGWLAGFKIISPFNDRISA